jgi:glycine cleavage system H protein
MPRPTGCRFSQTHEWADLDGQIVTVGITQYAADALTDVTYIDLKPARTMVLPGESIGEVESVKATADVYAPVGGEIVAVNEEPARTPSLLNSDPYGRGWLVKIRTADPSPLDALMDHETYSKTYPTKR